MSDDKTVQSDPEAPSFHGPMFPAPQGWICPSCGRANAPFVSQCPCYVQAPPSYPPWWPWPPQPPYHPSWPYYVERPYVGDPPPGRYPIVTCCAGGLR